MADYISREAALKKLQMQLLDLEADQDKGEYSELCENRGARDALDGAIYDIRTLKAADVQPVKRGRWIETHISLCKWIPEDEKEEGHSFYMAELKCSCCERYNAVTFVLTLNKPDFCQLCGARMDGDTE
jgi:hypothetical protein